LPIQLTDSCQLNKLSWMQARMDRFLKYRCCECPFTCQSWLFGAHYKSFVNEQVSTTCTSCMWWLWLYAVIRFMIAKSRCCKC
jgi:hypothetical protein